jgi:hypothetical protein
VLVGKLIAAQPRAQSGFAVTLWDFEQGAPVAIAAVGTLLEQLAEKQLLKQFQPYGFAPVVPLAASTVLFDPAYDRRAVRWRISQRGRRQWLGNPCRPRQDHCNQPRRGGGTLLMKRCVYCAVSQPGGTRPGIGQLCVVVVDSAAVESVLCRLGGVGCGACHCAIPFRAL